MVNKIINYIPCKRKKFMELLKKTDEIGLHVSKYSNPNYDLLLFLTKNNNKIEISSIKVVDALNETECSAVYTTKTKLEKGIVQYNDLNPINLARLLNKHVTDYSGIKYSPDSLKPKFLSDKVLKESELFSQTGLNSMLTKPNHS